MSFIYVKTSTNKLIMEIGTFDGWFCIQWVVARSTEWLCWNPGWGDWLFLSPNKTSRNDEDDERLPSELLRWPLAYFFCRCDPELFFDETLPPVPSSNFELLLEFPCWNEGWLTANPLTLLHPPPTGVPALCCLGALFNNLAGYESYLGWQVQYQT